MSETPTDREETVAAPASEPAASEQSASYLHPDTAAASSQRLRLIPPDGKPPPWWVRHRDKLMLVEMLLTGLFFLLALYFLWLWIFAEPPIAYQNSRDGFVRALAALPPVRHDPAWRVPAKSGRWTHIIVHHTGAAMGSPASIDRYHREERKWENGLGYHFLIGNGKGMDDGEVHMTRRWLEQLDGAHIKKIRDGREKSNSYCIGVALVGNFEETLATPKQLASLRGVLSFLAREYGIAPDAIFGHGQAAANPTACPGRLFFLDEVARLL